MHVTYKNVGDNTRLTKGSEDGVEDAGKEDAEGDLDGQKRGVKFEDVISFPDLIGISSFNIIAGAWDQVLHLGFCFS